jgi:phosphoglycolate phosphatase
MKNRGAVFFDLDGTLVDTSLDILNSLTYAADSVGQPRLHFLRDLIGLPVREILLRTLPSGDHQLVDEAVRAFRLHHDLQPMRNWVHYPGLQDLLKLLSALSLNYFVVTNRPRSGVENLVKSGFTHINIDRYFSVGDHGTQSKQEALEYLVKSQKIDTNACIAFGDQIADIVAAEMNNIVGYFCDYGFGRLSPGQVANSRIVYSLHEIELVLLEIFPLTSSTQTRSHAIVSGN